MLSQPCRRGPGALRRARRSPDRDRAVKFSGPVVYGRAAEPELDRRLDLHLDRRGLALGVRRNRPVLAPGDGLVDERRYDGPVGFRLLANGSLAARQDERGITPIRAANIPATSSSG